MNKYIFTTALIGALFCNNVFAKVATWYNGNTRVAQNTCTYDGQITLPQQPTKVGYTFNGWKLKTN